MRRLRVVGAESATAPVPTVGSTTQRRFGIIRVQFTPTYGYSERVCGGLQGVEALVARQVLVGTVSVSSIVARAWFR